MLKLFKVVLSIFLSFSVYDICHQKTLGFALVNIKPTHYSEFETNVQKQEIDEIFKQPFYLFANGGQSYVFKSQDDQYVLKLFKFHHLRIPPILSYIPLNGKLETFREKKLAFKRKKLDQTFESYINAFNNFKEDSLLFEVSLSNKPGRYQSTITIYDAQKIPFVIDPNTTPFALQKKVVLFEGTVKEKLKEKNFDFVLEATCKCMDLIAKRVNKGFIDNDCYLHKNIGLSGTDPMLLDIGTLEKIDQLDYLSKIKQVEYVMTPIFEMVKEHTELHEKIMQHWDEVKKATLL